MVALLLDAQGHPIPRAEEPVRLIGFRPPEGTVKDDKDQRLDAGAGGVGAAGAGADSGDVQCLS
jgi:hypothetical protein